MIAITNPSDGDKPVWPKAEVGIRGTCAPRLLLGPFQNVLVACEIMN